MKRITLTLYLFLLCLITGLKANQWSDQLLFAARLSGDQEVPEVTTDAQGLGSFSYDISTRMLYISVKVNALSGPVTGIHIHAGVAGENGPVVIDLTPFLNGTTLKQGMPITPADLSRLIRGEYYLNVHTAENTDGEIRGQILLETDHRFAAVIEGAQEVPEVTTDAKGLGIFHLTHSQKSVAFDVLFTGLSGPVTGAHLHNAPAGENGGVVLDLGPFLDGNSISGTWEPGGMLDALLEGELYINIHTDANPDGEIRGQIVLTTGFTFDARLDGAQENPGMNTSGRGLGIVTLDTEMNDISYHVLFDSLSGPATSAHFHQAPAGTNGGVVMNITDDIDGNLIIGSQAYTTNLFRNLLRGQLYINVHTTAHPGGEIRGQVYKFAREPFLVEFNGGQEVPPVNTNGNGIGLVTLDRDFSDAHYMMVVGGLEGGFAGAAFHQGTPGTNGDAINDFTQFFNNFGGSYGYWDADSVTPFDPEPFRSEEVYINILSDLHPTGEIRGNLVRSTQLSLPQPFDPEFDNQFVLSAFMSGEDVVPATSSNGVGLVTMFFDEDHTRVKINITVSGLTGPMIGINIYEADPGVNGPVLFPLENVGNRVQQTITDIDAFDLISLLNGAAYVSVLTDAFPGGEIRGQLVLEQDVSFIAQLNGENENPPVISDARGLATVHYTLGKMEIEVNTLLTGLSSEIIGANLHSGGLDENGPVIINLDDIRNGNRIQGRKDIDVFNLVDLLFNNVYINIQTADHPEGEIRGQVNFFPGITFDGWLEGNQQVPFVTTQGSALAIGTVFPSPQDLALIMLADGTSGPVVASHLHRARTGENGPIVHDLSDDLVNNSFVHIGVIPNAVFDGLMQGEVYLSAHTAAYPDGELRGQLIRRTRDGYAFDLCPEQETDMVDAPDAVGSGLVSIGRDHSNVNVFVVADGTTGDVTAAHFHEAPIGLNGGVVFDLGDFLSGNIIAAYAEEVDTSVVNALRSGEIYVNMHTDMHSAGELRGQVVNESLCTLVSGLDPIAEILDEIRLSPVPVVDVLNVSMDAHQAAALSFNIIDVTGKLMSSTSYSVSVGQQTFSIPTQVLGPGFYTLFITDGQRGQALKFVK